MRLAADYDIHGNLPAIKSFYKDIERSNVTDPRCKVKRCSSCLFGKQMRQTIADCPSVPFSSTLIIGFMAALPGSGFDKRRVRHQH